MKLAHIVDAIAGDWTPTAPAPVPTRARMLALVANASKHVPAPRLLNFSDPADEGRGQVTMWLAIGDVEGVDLWATLLVEAGATTLTPPGLDPRRYPATGAPGTWHAYRAELALNGWRVAVNCQVIDPAAVTR